MVHTQKNKEVTEIILQAQENKNFIAFYKHVLHFTIGAEVREINYYVCASSCARQHPSVSQWVTLCE